MLGINFNCTQLDCAELSCLQDNAMWLVIFRGIRGTHGSRKISETVPVLQAIRYLFLEKISVGEWKMAGVYGTTQSSDEYSNRLIPYSISRRRTDIFFSEWVDIRSQQTVDQHWTSCDTICPGLHTWVPVIYIAHIPSDWFIRSTSILKLWAKNWPCRHSQHRDRSRSIGAATREW